MAILELSSISKTLKRFRTFEWYFRKQLTREVNWAKYEISRLSSHSRFLEKLALKQNDQSFWNQAASIERQDQFAGFYSVPNCCFAAFSLLSVNSKTSFIFFTAMMQVWPLCYSLQLLISPAYFACHRFRHWLFSAEPRSPFYNSSPIQFIPRNTVCC